MDIRYSLADNTNTNNNEDTNSQNTKTRYNRTNNPIDTGAQAKGDYFDYGAKPVRNADIVRETKYGPTSQSARTIANSEYVTNETAKAMEEEALRGEYAYERVTNKGDREEAIKTIQKLGEKKSIQRVLNDNDISHMSKNIAMAEELINQFCQMLKTNLVNVQKSCFKSLKQDYEIFKYTVV